jgi:hypothetical protein
MEEINYHKKTFKGVENYDEGDLNPLTRFHYFHKGEAVWGKIDGGRVVHGSLVARIMEDGKLDMMWHYVNIDGEVVSGTCISAPEVLDDGRIRLHEVWKIDGGIEGESVIEEE